MSTLLSIDWDWVTGDCSEGNGCCGWCKSESGPLADGCIVHLDSNWEERLERLKSFIDTITFNGCFTHLWVAECHADIVRIVDSSSRWRIIHLDQHTDKYDWSGLTCGSWRHYLPAGTRVKHYRSGKLPQEMDCSNVFVCKSSPWTPRKLDNFFWGVVHCLSRHIGHAPMFVGHMTSQLVREWTVAVRKTAGSSLEAY